MSSVEYVRSVCKRKKIAIQKLEKDLGFANGYLNPKKLKKIPYERAVLISNYLEIPLERVMGTIGEIQNSYFLDDETAQIAQELQENHDLRIIFDAVRKASKEDLEFIKDIVERMNL